MSSNHAKLIAIDPGLSTTGWAAFFLDNAKPFAAGVMRPPGPKAFLENRLLELQTMVSSLFDELRLTATDILVCEGPAPLVKNPNSVMKMERVRGVFETLARSRGATVPGRLNPRTVQTELLGMRGKQLAREEVKKWARDVVVKLYKNEFAALKLQNTDCQDLEQLPQDIVDALLVGTLAAARVNHAKQCGIELEAAFAPKPTKRTSGRKGSSRFTWSEADVVKLLGNQR